ncbi:MAG: dephospho-CoA kinase [Kiritimatiellia bacterium]|nr:dephospho-CoA kinase [Kiritimatiellia bacterium]
MTKQVIRLKAEGKEMRDHPELRVLRKVCVTGGIACGKSSLGEMLRKLGAGVIDADEVCHELLRKSKPLIDRIVSAFGAGILNRNGGIDRRILGRIVFNDDKKRKKLNALVHPKARRVINAWLKMQGARVSVAVAIVPLAYEAGWERGWDAVVCVAAPLSTQIARLKRKGFSEKDARMRIAAQMPLAEKMNRADYVIFNAGTVASLRQQAMLVFRNVKEKTERCYGRKK